MDLQLMDLLDLATEIRKSTVEIKPEELADQLIKLEADHRIELTKARYEEQRPAPTVRARVNVSDSVKGIRTTDTTLEFYGDLRDYNPDRVTEMRVELSAKVDAEYPPPPLA